MDNLLVQVFLHAASFFELLSAQCPESCALFSWRLKSEITFRRIVVGISYRSEWQGHHSKLIALRLRLYRSTLCDSPKCPAAYRVF